MSLVSDRAAVQLALECASRLPAEHQPPLTYEQIRQNLETLLMYAEDILAWHDTQVAKRSKADSLRVNAPKQEYHPNIT